MEYNSSNLPDAYEKFERHAKLMFSGPLKEKTEEEQVSYFLLWVGDRGRDIHSTWRDILADDTKKLDTYFSRFRAYVQPKLNPMLWMTTPSSMAASRFKIQYLTTALGRIPFSSVVMVLAYQPGGPGSNPARIIYFCHAFIHFFLCCELCS